MDCIDSNVVVDTELAVPVRPRYVLGAVLGSLVGLYMSKAFEYIVPYLNWLIDRVEYDAAVEAYGSSTLAAFYVPPMCSILAGLLAGYIARRRGALVGILSSSVAITVLLVIIVRAVWGEHGNFIGVIPVERWALIMLPVLVFVAALSGYVGEMMSYVFDDIDQHDEKATVIGIFWPHYLWGFPLLIYPYFTTIILLLYASYQYLRVMLYVTLSPSMWASNSFMNLLYYGIALIIAGALWMNYIKTFVRIMNHKNKTQSWISKCGYVVICIICGTLIPSIISAFVASTMAGFLAVKK
jgi:hypothetical protein